MQVYTFLVFSLKTHVNYPWTTVNSKGCWSICYVWGNLELDLIVNIGEDDGW